MSTAGSPTGAADPRTDKAASGPSPEAAASAPASVEQDADTDKLFDLSEENATLDEAAPSRSLSDEWKATLAAVAASDYKWLKLIFIEMPHIVRAILSFPKTAFAAVLRLGLIGVRIFITSKTGKVVEPDATGDANNMGSPTESGSPAAPAQDAPVPADDAAPADTRVYMDPPENLAEGAGSQQPPSDT